MIKKILILLIWTTVFSSCASKKDDRPDWVKRRPIDDAHYTGIGIVQKGYMTVKEYSERAKNNALNDLASEISIKISSTSILNTLDLGDSFDEDYQSQIKTSSNIELDNYQLMGTYENGVEYWVYYRINKLEYQSKKNQKLNSSISRAKDFYNRAKKYEDENYYKQAFIYYINALESVENYWAEGLETELNGKKVFLGNEIYNSINDLVRSIKISTTYSTIDVKKGDFLNGDIIKFSVTNKSDVPLEDIPVYYYYSGKPISNTRQYFTDKNGIVSYDLGKIVSNKNKEYFKVNLNLVEIVKTSTKNPLIAKLVAKINTPSKTIDINISTPYIYIDSPEKNVNDNSLYSIIKEHFEAKNMVITENKEKADIIIKIDVETTKGEYFESAKLLSVNLTSKFKILDSKGGDIFYSVSTTSGVGESYQDAEEKCYRELKKDLKYNISNQIYRKVFE